MCIIGCWLLAVGCWLLAVGCWLLAVGCWLLAEDHGLKKLPVAVFLSLPFAVLQWGILASYTVLYHAPLKKSSFWGEFFVSGNPPLAFMTNLINIKTYLFALHRLRYQIVQRNDNVIDAPVIRFNIEHQQLPKLGYLLIGVLPQNIML
jgi:hypothetical protein